MFLLSSTRLDRSNFMALYYGIFWKIKLTAQVINRDIYHFWLRSFMYPFIIIYYKISILFTAFDIFVVSRLYKSDVEEYIVSHTRFAHITSCLASSPVSYHATCHTIYSRKLYKDTDISEFSESRVTESEKTVKDDKILWLYYFPRLSLCFPSWITSEIIFWYLYLLSIFELFDVSDEKICLESFWRVKIFKFISFKFYMKTFWELIMGIIIHVHGYGIDPVCSKSFDDFFGKIAFSRTASADEINEIHIL